MGLYLLRSCDTMHSRNYRIITRWKERVGRKKICWISFVQNNSTTNIAPIARCKSVGNFSSIRKTFYSEAILLLSLLLLMLFIRPSYLAFVNIFSLAKRIQIWQLFRKTVSPPPAPRHNRRSSRFYYICLHLYYTHITLPPFFTSKLELVVASFEVESEKNKKT